jgi:hypothetical protein
MSKQRKGRAPAGDGAPGGGEQEKEKGKGGRPSRLETEPKVVAVFLQAIGIGSYFEPAAWAAGLHPDTVRNWIERGQEEGGGPYVEFFETYKKAEATAEITALANVRARTLNWQAAMTFLERRYCHRPESWARRDRQEHTGAQGAPLPGPAVGVVGGAGPKYVGGLQEAHRLLYGGGDGKGKTDGKDGGDGAG